jgi:hypothetical protein
VLYSLANEAWKVTDFGFTMEGSSRKALTSKTSRGTNCYRAPELLIDTDPRYTNKVDMWAVGCILYELVFRGRAFREDYYIYKYAESSRKFQLELTAEVVPDARKRDFLAKVICELLDVEPQRRPRARDLYERFISWGSDGAAPVTRMGTNAMETTTIVNEAPVHDNVNSTTDATQPDADPSPPVSKVAGASPNPLPSQLEANVDEAPVDPHLFRDVPTAADYPKEAVALNPFSTPTASVHRQSLVDPDSSGEVVFHSQEIETMPAERTGHLIDILMDVEPYYRNEAHGKQVAPKLSFENIGEESEAEIADTVFTRAEFIAITDDIIRFSRMISGICENSVATMVFLANETDRLAEFLIKIQGEAMSLDVTEFSQTHDRRDWDIVWNTLSASKTFLENLYEFMISVQILIRHVDEWNAFAPQFEFRRMEIARFRTTLTRCLNMQKYNSRRKEISDDNKKSSRPGNPGERNIQKYPIAGNKVR